jgi:membrane-associated phospholipid phosphatase
MKKIIVLHLFFALLTFSSGAQNLDIRLLSQIHAPETRVADAPWRALTHVSPPLSCTPVLGFGLAYAFEKDKIKRTEFGRQSLESAATVVLTTGITFLLKKTIARPRPFEAHPNLFLAKVKASSLQSFPSGHTSLAFAAATTLMLNTKSWKFYVPAFLLAGASGYSRMHLGVHYPSDVLAGAITGVASAWAIHEVRKAWFK